MSGRSWNLGDKRIVTRTFEYDGMKFMQGELFTLIREPRRNSTYRTWGCHFHEYHNKRHSCNGITDRGHGWNVIEWKLIENTTFWLDKPTWEL